MTATAWVVPTASTLASNASADSIAGIIARVDELLGRAVEASASAYAVSPASDPLRGLFVSDADAGRLIRRGSEPLAGDMSFDFPLVDLAVAGEPWRCIASTFSLAPIEVDILALAMAPQLDLRYERIFGYLHDDVTKRRLTPDLACQLLCGSFDERLDARRLFAPDATLVRHALVHLVPDPGQPNGSLISQGVNLDDGLIDLLLGHEDIDRRLGRAARWEREVASQRALSDEVLSTVGVLLGEMRRSTDVGLNVVLLGTDSQLKIDIARHAARELRRPLLVVDIPRLLQLDMPFAEAMVLVARGACLAGALTLWMRGDQLAGGGGSGPGTDTETARLDTWLTVLSAFNTTGNLLSLSAQPTAGSKWWNDMPDGVITIPLPLPGAVERRHRWTRRLSERGVTISPSDADLLAEVFRVDGAAIDRAIEQALVIARWRNPETCEVAADDLFTAARAQILKSLPRYATRMDAGPRWDDIVLPADQLRQLRELCDRVRHRRTVLEDWGFARRLTLGRGIAALFAGPSGTGKTMAAQIIATTLGMDLYRVEIPAVVSKYIGETEKALDQLFREAQGTSVVLFFDEADALFGKRSEVKDAHDRYANIEISYLLQAIEQYDGLTILATNLRHNVDDAFIRRLAFAVTFPLPDERERRRIWEKSWPAQVPMAEDIDLEFLSRQFKLAGGNIRNVALASAFAAAADGGRVTMTHVVRGVRREFQKMGKTCVESDFGSYFELLEIAR